MSLLQLRIHNVTWIEDSENQALVLSSWLRSLRVAEFNVKRILWWSLPLALQACFVVLRCGFLRPWNS